MDEDIANGLEQQIDSPLARWAVLRGAVQDLRLKRFSDVSQDFLDLLWSLDQYRISGTPPPGMGNPDSTDDQRLDAAVRMKGGWFATLVSLLLENQVSSPLASRTQIQGFSQTHQIDIAWPAKRVIPLVCVETKVMGGPPYKRYAARAATADWSNRRKELKFQATDLKLYRRRQETHIDHWDNWRRSAPPLVYFLWCARLKPAADSVERMVGELRGLTETYLDGAGLLPYKENADGTGYEAVPLPWRDRVVELDDLIHRIANQIAEFQSEPPSNSSADPLAED